MSALPPKADMDQQPVVTPLCAKSKHRFLNDARHQPVSIRFSYLICQVALWLMITACRPPAAS
jgi:hypothetical protein